ncbi:MAG: NAD(P)-dependent oxidoreductase [Deltaproteobacteria bacterium]|nr:NAD(P)-dependent oxidoreductase [Deltaproteobacteria bacterium]
MKRIAVFGATGQVGRAIISRWARSRNTQIVAIVRNEFGALGLKGLPNTEIRTGDPANADSVAELLEGCDAVLNSALATGLPNQSRALNRAMVENSAEVARRAGRLRAFVQLSSVAVYGFPVAERKGDFTRPQPATGYGRDKLYIEEIVRRSFTSDSCPGHVVRVGHVLGPYQGHSRGIIAQLFDPSFQLPFDGSKPSNAIHVDHLAFALRALIDQRGSSNCFNAVGDGNPTWHQVFEDHARTVGTKMPRSMSPEESSQRRAAELAKLRSSRMVQAARDTLRPAVSAFVSAFASSPAIRDLGHEVLVRAPRSAESAIKRAYTSWSARDQTSAVSSSPQTDVPPWYYWDGVPGPNLLERFNVQQELTAAEIESDLKAWASAMANPL